VQWDNDLVFKVRGKMFACLDLKSESYSFKCSESEYFELSEMPGVRPAPYLARAHWVQISPSECQLGAKRLRQLVEQSYHLVVARLPKKIQKDLNTN